MGNKGVLKRVIALLAALNVMVYATGTVAYFDIIDIPFLDKIFEHFQRESLEEKNGVENDIADDVAQGSQDGDDDSATIRNDDTASIMSQEWKQAYLDLMSKPGGDSVQYKLVYIDDDEIPELYIVGNCTAQGDMLCVYKDGEIYGIHMYNYGLSYLERENSFCDSGGHMDMYYDYVYSLGEEGAIIWHKGEFGAEDNSRVQCDAEGNPLYVYSWDGDEVSKKEYEENLNEAYDKDKAIWGYEGAFEQDEMIEIIERLGVSRR